MFLPQVESTVALQALQPRVKEMQEKYANDTETLQLETARLYQTAGVNPLAGCVPTLATIPVFIGLYRALSKAAEDGLLTSGFFWIPSLGGPTSMAANKAVSHVISQVVVCPASRAFCTVLGVLLPCYCVALVVTGFTLACLVTIFTPAS